MDGSSLSNAADGSANYLVKKRGRPRKHPKPNPSHDQQAGATPRCEASRGEDPNHRTDEIRMGQKVHGVIEASFDAGYLLTVRAGSSGTTLRGIVFKPGHCVPVSADNDVAPNIPMVRRGSYNFPARSSRHSRGSKALDFTNEAAHQYDGRSTPNKLQPLNEVSRQVMRAAAPEASNVPNGVFPEATMRPHGRPFEALLSEVMRGVSASTQPDGDNDDDGQALSVEPLRAIHPSHSVTTPQHFHTGKMTELLQAVQENTRQGQASQNEDPGEGTRYISKVAAD